MGGSLVGSLLCETTPGCCCVDAAFAENQPQPLVVGGDDSDTASLGSAFAISMIDSSCSDDSA